MPVFEALNVDKSFSGHKALDKVSIHVPEGSIYGLLGPNGAGKTTLIRIINRIIAPDKGELIFQGRKFTSDDIGLIGYLPEERGLYRKMKVGEQVLYLSCLKGLTKGDAMQKLKFWFEKFEINNWWNKKVEELSKGMAQKIQFIITVLHEPKLLIFDEPFSGFDPINAEMLKKEVQELKENGATIIFSTHDMASVEELCDHISLIDKSRTVLEGSIHDIREQFRNNLYELKFSGDPDTLKAALNGNYGIREIKKQFDGDYTAKIKLSDKKEGRDLIQTALNCVQIHSFKDVLPGMNEIFINAVKGIQTTGANE